jgi:hypothetical protein
MGNGYGRRARQARPISHTATTAIKAKSRTIGAPCSQLMKKSATAKINYHRGGDNCRQPIKSTPGTQPGFARFPPSVFIIDPGHRRLLRARESFQRRLLSAFAHTDKTREPVTEFQNIAARYRRLGPPERCDQIDSTRFLSLVLYSEGVQFFRTKKDAN